MTGRQKMEAALGPDGSPQTPAVICYEGIYIRDHWDELLDCPWWYQFSPEIDHQVAWQRQACLRGSRSRRDFPVYETAIGAQTAHRQPTGFSTNLMQSKACRRALGSPRKSAPYRWR